MHPVDFARDVLEVTLWDKQNEFLDMIYRGDRVSVKSGHGVGKTYAEAVAAIWFFSEHCPALVLTTAPTFRQVKRILWKEIRKLWRKTPWGISDKGHSAFVDPNLTEITLSDDRAMYGFSTDKPVQLQGAHNPNMLVLVDEANGVPDEMFTAFLGLLTSDNAKLALMGNPIIPEGYFYKSHMPGSGFDTMTISSLETPNHVSGNDDIPGLATRKWVEEQKREWGEDSPSYKAMVLGEFPDSAEDALIPRTLIEAALERGKAELPKYEPESARMGVDVARFGGDKTVFVVRDRHAVRYIEAYQGKNLMHTVARTQLISKQFNIDKRAIAIDDTGMGGGVTDRLRELGVNIMPIDFGMRAVEHWKYANMRAEMYMTMSRALNDQMEPPGLLAITPEYEFICRELMQPHYTFTSSQQIKLEPKKDIKKRLGRSPDHADALALTFAPLAPSMKVEMI